MIRVRDFGMVGLLRGIVGNILFEVGSGFPFGGEGKVSCGCYGFDVHCVMISSLAYAEITLRLGFLVSQIFSTLTHILIQQYLL